MKASDFVALYLEARGVTHVFELVGGMITHLLDSIDEKTTIDIVSCHHEQAAAFAAEGYARITGMPGVALATSGPGATNLLTAVGSCFFDSSPAIFITGQVNTYELKEDRGVRQLGFQETDIVSMATPICKLAVQVKTAADLAASLDTAFRVALEGRQGPCLVDIPMNVQSEAIDDATAYQLLQALPQTSSTLDGYLQSASRGQEIKEYFTDLIDQVNQSERPLILMGGGCTAPTNRQAARHIVELLGIPVALSLMAVDLLPHSHPQRVGFIGSYGNRWANKVLGAADLLIVVGSRLDIRQTGSNLESFCEGKQIWQIDIDESEIGVRIKPHRGLCCSIRSAAEVLTSLASNNAPRHLDWLKEINELRSRFPACREYPAEPGEVNPIQLLQKLSGIINRPCQFITDVGQHQMWAAQSIHFKDTDRFITSGGMGAMGFGLPTAIGSAFSNKGALNILVTGDGSFQLNIQELETVMRNQLDIKIVLFNNRCHGMVRQFQESYFNHRLRSTVDGYSAPDFVAVSRAYGMPAQSVQLVNELDENLDWLVQAKGPALLEIPLSIHSKVYPKLAFGRRFGEMEPEASPIAMEST